MADIIRAAVDEGLLREARERIELITWEKDGSEMVLIPAGSFEMEAHFNEEVQMIGHCTP